MDDTHEESGKPQLRAASYARLSETYDGAESVPTQLADADKHAQRRGGGWWRNSKTTAIRGFPDGLPRMVAEGLPRGGATVRARPFRPSCRACARVTCRRVREARDGTTFGTITHGDRSSAFRARRVWHDRDGGAGHIHTRCGQRPACYARSLSSANARNARVIPRAEPGGPTARSIWHARRTIRPVIMNDTTRSRLTLTSSGSSRLHSARRW